MNEARVRGRDRYMLDPIMLRTLASHRRVFKYSSDMIWFTFFFNALESGLQEYAGWWNTSGRKLQSMVTAISFEGNRDKKETVYNIFLYTFQIVHCMHVFLIH